VKETKKVEKKTETRQEEVTEAPKTKKWVKKARPKGDENV
jgi:hypothetical protein